MTPPSPFLLSPPPTFVQAPLAVSTSQEARVRDQSERDPSFAREVIALTRTSEALVRVCDEADALFSSGRTAPWLPALGPVGPLGACHHMRRNITSKKAKQADE